MQEKKEPDISRQGQPGQPDVGKQGGQGEIGKQGGKPETDTERKKDIGETTERR